MLQTNNYCRHLIVYLSVVREFGFIRTCTGMVLPKYFYCNNNFFVYLFAGTAGEVSGQYIGCFKDNAISRDITGSWEHWSDTTPQICVKRCLSKGKLQSPVIFNTK